MKQSMKALLVAGVLGVSATACMTHAEFNGVTYDTAAGTITITDGSKSITMMDKNLGATTVGWGSGDNAPATSYGDHYQWGGTTGYAGTLSSGDAIAAGFNPDWTSEGWTKETDPCPDGYHVPTSQEWLDTDEMFFALNPVDGLSAMGPIISYLNAFKLPFAGLRDYSSSSVRNQGSDAYYWSSTASGGTASGGSAYNMYADSSVLNRRV